MDNNEPNILYKLGGLEALVTSSMTRIDDKLQDLSKTVDKKLEQMDGRFEKIENEISEIKTWKTVLTTRMGLIVSIIVIAWSIFGQTVERIIGGLF